MATVLAVTVVTLSRHPHAVCRAESLAEKTVQVRGPGGPFVFLFACHWGGRRCSTAAVNTQKIHECSQRGRIWLERDGPDFPFLCLQAIASRSSQVLSRKDSFHIV